MKDGIANNSTASISQARKAVEQLKMEACMDRIKVQLLSLFFFYVFIVFRMKVSFIVPLFFSENTMFYVWAQSLQLRQARVVFIPEGKHQLTVLDVLISGIPHAGQ